MRHTQILAISTLGMLLMTGCTKADTPVVDAAAKPVAVVNGTPISRDVWNLYVKTRHGGRILAAARNYPRRDNKVNPDEAKGR